MRSGSERRVKRISIRKEALTEFVKRFSKESWREVKGC